MAETYNELFARGDGGDQTANGEELSLKLDRDILYNNSNFSSVITSNFRWLRNVNEFGDGTSYADLNEITSVTTGFTSQLSKVKADIIFGYNGYCLQANVLASASNMFLRVPVNLLNTNQGFISQANLRCNVELHISDNAAVRYGIYQISNSDVYTQIGGSYPNDTVLTQGVNILEATLTGYDTDIKGFAIRFFDDVTNSLEGKLFTIGRIYLGEESTSKVELKEDIVNFAIDSRNVANEVEENYSNLFNYNRFLTEIAINDSYTEETHFYFDGTFDYSYTDTVDFDYVGKQCNINFTTVNSGGLIVNYAEITQSKDFDSGYFKSIIECDSSTTTSAFNYRIYTVKGGVSTLNTTKVINLDLGYNKLILESSTIPTDTEFIILRMFLPAASMNGETLKYGRIFLSSQSIGDDILESNAGDAINFINQIYDTIPKNATKVYCWGDSITATNQWQSTVATMLGIANSDMINKGVSSDLTQHIRDRFVAFYTANPDELQYPIVIGMGTNNLNLYDSGDVYAQMYSKSYRDQFLNDIKQMINMIPHSNYLIWDGWVDADESTSAQNYIDMIDLNNDLVKLYSNNYVNARDGLNVYYDFGNAYLSASYVQPAVGGNVTISVTDASIITGVRNPESPKTICVGTKELYDRFEVVSVLGNDITCKLLESNIGIAESSTVNPTYTLTSALLNDTTIPIQVFIYQDTVTFNKKLIPKSCGDNIHPTHAYDVLGKVIGYSLLSVLNQKKQ